MRSERLPSAARTYIGVVSVIALGCAVLLWSADRRTAGLAEFVSITALGMLAHAYPIRASRHQAYQVTLPFIIMAAALFSTPQLVAFTLLIHVGEQIRVRRPLYIQLFNLGNYFLSALAAAVFYQRALAIMPAGTLSLVEAALAAGCTFIVINRLLLSVALWTARGLSPVRSGLFSPELLAADLIIIWISGPMLVLSSHGGVGLLLVAAGPLCLARVALGALLAQPRNSSPKVPAQAA